MKNIGVILARGASKRLPRKNLHLLGGLPLIAWTCRAACASTIDRVIVSTEDSGIAEIAKSHGVDVPFIRPNELAEDYARDVDIVLHAVDAAQHYYGEMYDTVTVIQSTSPFVRPEHIDACIRRYSKGDSSCIFIARKVQDHPRWTWIADDEGNARPFIGEALTADEQHSQNLVKLFYPTGAAWVANIEEVRAQDTIYCGPIGLVEIPWEYAIDVDEIYDLLIAETLAKHFSILPILSKTESAASNG